MCALYLCVQYSLIYCWIFLASITLFHKVGDWHHIAVGWLLKTEHGTAPPRTFFTSRHWSEAKNCRQQWKNKFIVSDEPMYERTDQHIGSFQHEDLICTCVRGIAGLKCWVIFVLIKQLRFWFNWLLTLQTYKGKSCLLTVHEHRQLGSFKTCWNVGQVRTERQEKLLGSAAQRCESEFHIELKPWMDLSNQIKGYKKDLPCFLQILLMWPVL